MTIEEAIKILKAIRVYECYPKSASEETKEALDMVIGVLSESNVHNLHNGDLISRKDAIEAMRLETGKQGLLGRGDILDIIFALPSADTVSREFYEDAVKANIKLVIENRELKEQIESADAKTDGDMGEVSDGYHTFNQLYHQRAVLFATIVKQNKEKAWKSWKHGDGKFCFDSNKEWFIIGVDTPEGSYTYHFKKKYWDMFDCIELEYGKFWDGHTEEDVTRLLSLPSAEADDTQTEEQARYVSKETELAHIEAKLENAEKRLQELLKHIAEADWIPCSERLPSEKDGQILVTKHRGVRIATYSEFSSTWYLGEMCAVGREDPIAWMPLPKPYRKEREDYELATEQMEHDAMYESTYNSEDGSM